MRVTTRPAGNEGPSTAATNWKTISAVVIGTVLGILLAMWLGELGESVLSPGWNDLGV